MEVKISRLMLTMLVAVAMATSMTQSETIVPGGNVSGLWDVVGSPYMIQGNITVPTNETLIIEPGVSVVFQGTYGWYVQGLLEAIGTATDSILITCQDTVARWYGIRFDSAPDSSHLSFCIVEYGKSNGWYAGGGVYIYDSNPVISHCTFRYNTGYRGGAIQVWASQPHITFNDIIYNGGITTTSYGGGVCLDNGSSGYIAFNNFTGNRCWDCGGGISILKYGGEIEIIGNYFLDNYDANGGDGGGGFMGDGYLADLHITLSGNIFVGNYSQDRGGGLLTHSVQMNKLVIYNNATPRFGGGLINLSGSPSTIRNSIAWNNAPNQFYPSSFQGYYCDVQNGWPGIGNISSDPQFVAPEYYDFRLQWGSPCIDAGDPNPANNDPDGTRGDIGAFYYDQSVPVRVLLTPHERSIVIPPVGGVFDYTLWLTNIDPSNPEFTFWVDVTLPDGSTFGPVLGPMTAQLDSGVTVGRERTQSVPARAMEGVYAYNAYAVVGADTSQDGFSFFKMEPGLSGIADWRNVGKSLEDLGEVHIATAMASDYSLEQNYPNPFNPVTCIRFGLHQAGFVKLAIYDLLGRQVALLADGYRGAGVHEVSFDASELSSGVYVCRLQTGDFTAVKKMVVMK